MKNKKLNEFTNIIILFLTRVNQKVAYNLLKVDSLIKAIYEL